MSPNDVPEAMILLVISLLVICANGEEKGCSRSSEDVKWDDLTQEGFEKRDRILRYDEEQRIKRIMEWNRPRTESHEPGVPTVFPDNEFDIRDADEGPTKHGGMDSSVTDFA